MSASPDWDRAFKSAYRRAYGVLDNRASAQEVAQDACLKGWLLMDSFRGTGSFEAWIAVIAYRLAIDRKRAEQSRMISARPLGDGGDGPPDRPAFQRERARVLDGCIETLPERQREALLLRYAEGLKYAEIASQMNIVGGTVGKTLSDALSNMLDCLKRHGMDAVN
jgi:RNA polymerase sigma-70 factor (ECF subfamily)